MPRISMGDFAQATVVPRPERSSVQFGDGGSGRALDNLAGSLGQVANDIARVGQQQREQEEGLARAKASNALLDYELQVSTKVDDIRQRLLTGDLQPGDSEFTATQEIGQIERPNVRGLGEIGAVQFDGAFQQAQRKGILQVQTAARTAERQLRKTEVIGAFDRMDKLAGLPDADIDRLTTLAGAMSEQWREAGLDPSEFENKRQSYADRWWVQHASRREMLARDDSAALDALADDLTKDDGYYATRLDATQRNMLLNRVLVGRERLDARSAVESNKREAAASRVIEQYEKQVATGVPAPADVMIGWASAVAGTSLEGEFQLIQRGEVELQQVMKLPPVEQRSYLQKLKAQQQTQGATVSDQLRAERLERAIETRLKALRESPLEFHGATTGQAVPPLNLGLLASGNAAGLREQIEERQTLLRAQRARYGAEAGMSPFLPQEASALAGMLAKAPPQQAAQVFGTVRDLLDDPKAYEEAMRQIAPDAPLRAEAGRIYALQRPAGSPPGGITATSPNGQYGDVALTILRGETLLNPGKDDGKAKPVAMPPPQEVQQHIAKQLGTAFAGRPEEYRRAVDAVNAYYAAKTADEGDANGRLNTERMNTAIKAVIGERVDIEGRGVIPPWGMPAETFRQRADLYIQARLKAAGREDPGDVSLVNVRGAPGYYALVRGFEPLYDNNDPPQPLVIRVGAKP